MLKFEKTAEIGDYIRSYDWKPMKDRGDCFMEGRVLDKDNHRYHVEVNRIIFDGEPQSFLNGTTFYTWFEVSKPSEWDGRIRKI